MANDIVDEHNTRIHQQLDSSQSYLAKISNNLSAQSAALLNVQFMIGGLHRLVCGEMKASWEFFGRKISKVWCVRFILRP